MRFIATIRVNGGELLNISYDHKDGFNPAHSAKKAREQAKRAYDERGDAGANLDVVETITALFEIFISSNLDTDGKYVGDKHTDKTVRYRDKSGREICYRFASMSKSYLDECNKAIDDKINADMVAKGIVIPS